MRKHVQNKQIMNNNKSTLPKLTNGNILTVITT